jgi:protein YibB
MKEITIVTAYFNINRENIKGFNRSSKDYISYFKFWARIQNKIVVFSDKETIEEVKKIRNEYGLLEKTETVVINDYLKIDEELYKSIENVMSNKFFLPFHLQTNIPEAINPKYNYIMLLKAWCCTYAVKNNLAKGMITWLDFGFNYGGRFYKNSNDFNFLWEYDFTDKIHLLQINELDNCPPFEIVRQNNSYFQGGEIVAPDYLWEEFWTMVRDNMLCLNRVGLADDDQLIYLMAYRQKPELFEIHKCEWLGLFKDFSRQKFNFEVPKTRKFYGFLYKCKHPTEFILVRKLLYSIKTFIILRKSKSKY